MTLQEIKRTVDEGKVVHWANELYEVRKADGDYYVVCTSNKSCIGLTWQDGATMNGKEEDFYIQNQ